MFKIIHRSGIANRRFLNINNLITKNVHKATNDIHYQIRKKPTFRDLVKAPIFKSIFLTIVFGTAIVGLIDSRRELETLEQTYDSKFVILEEIISKLERGENVDIHRELKLVNKLTKNKYNTVTDIELDEQLDEILKMTESESDEIREESRDSETKKYDKSQIETNKFL
ncbi:uncharacterized protein AC631_01420 [Debaryomyces fabryi]|uniref:Uncharacterized protein n=1 Tax=Debaryomyces fabryi TaxID=58627 RepID=A0A0V1Q2X4_9ASCO|nr:uncharacterized protein AC631_01420 [Debaryomyces fabryi]KSA02823.1 hypothetical protein AC631_01420 [Debaryomyces fabryi]CUM46117.1 unnamed protein product [Debaryomyces fabryi]